MGRPPASEAKLGEIISAALRLFWRCGIRATTVRRIAVEAGVTSGALYRHFSSKAGLAEALFESCAQRLTDSLRLARGLSQGPREELASLTAALLEFSQREPAAYGFLMERHHDDIGRLTPARELPKDLFEAAVKAGTGAGCFPAQDAGLTTALVIGMCLRAVFFFDRGMVSSSWEELVRRVVSAALLVAGEAPPRKERGHHGPGCAPDSPH